MISNSDKKISFVKRKKEGRGKVEKVVQKSITKTTTNKIDILDINDRIFKMLDEEYEELPNMKKKLQNLNWIINNTDDMNEKYKAQIEYNNLESEIELIESGFKEAKYIYKTEEIIKDYKRVLEEPIKIDFMGKAKNNEETEKQKIISKFLNIAKDYIDIDVFERKLKNNTCDNCKTELLLEDDFLFVCTTCGFAVKHFASVNCFQENNRINASQKYVYDKRSHFGDSMKKFQAKQNTTIADSVYKDLREKCHCHDIPIENITKYHIYEFLKLTGNAEHYEDITLIYSEITGKPPPNISHLENKLFELFDEVSPVYERVKPLGRTNFLNGQFILFKLLQKLHYNCTEDDFYILKTRDKMLEHDKIWKDI